MTRTKKDCRIVLHTILALMLCFFLIPAITSCGNDDEPIIEDEETETLVLTIKSGTSYDGTDLFANDPQYKNLKIELEYTKEEKNSVYYIYTEMYGSKINATGTCIMDNTAKTMTIYTSNGSYLTNDWGDTWDFNYNKTNSTFTMSPTIESRQKFVFSVSVVKNNL